MILKVKKNENPYDVIGSYIERHISVIDNIIAVISINGKICNELFLVEISSTSNFVWQTDWWEGEENVELIDFFFVSDACKEDNNNDLISRQAAIDALTEYGNGRSVYISVEEAVRRIEQMPPAEPKRIIGKWVGADTQCGIACSVCGVAVDDFCHSADYMDLDYEPNFCPNCGAKMEVTE